jgi:hypothetical protein
MYIHPERIRSHGPYVCSQVYVGDTKIFFHIFSPLLVVLYSTFKISQCFSNGLFTRTVIFSVGCDSHIQHRTKNRILPIFCAVSDAAVASDTENHVHVNRP